MTFGSLFSGIGGMDLGLERAGMECKWQVEVDPFCAQVLEKHWPKVKRYGDITKINGAELEQVELIAGGFPCTNTSNAGDRTGFDGKYSALWFDMLRIVRAVRPRLVLVENPPGLLSRGMGEVLGGLAESGYDAEWQCVPGFAVGAKHERARIFALAYPCGSRPSLTEQTAQGRWSDTGRDSVDCGDRQITLANAERAGLEGDVGGVMAARQSLARHASRCRSSFAGVASRKDGASQSWILRGVHGVPDRMDRVRACGNAVIPQVAEWIGKRIIEAEGVR